MGEEAVVALDGQHRLPGGELVTVEKRMHDQLVPAILPDAIRTLADEPPRAEPEHGQRLVHAAEHRTVRLLEDLHRHAGLQVHGLEHALGAVEVGVAVVALPEAVDGEGEDVGREA